MKCVRTLNLIMLVLMLSLFSGCVQRKKDEDGKTKAPGTASKGKGGTKIVFNYDARAPKEYLKVQKGPGEGSHVGVFVGETRMGTLNFGTIVQKIGEEKGWYKIRYYNNDAEFFGYIKYSEARPVEKPKTPVMIMVGEDAEPTMYTVQEVDDKLTEILKVPYELKVVGRGEDAETEKVFSSGSNLDGYGDISLLLGFKEDPQAHIHARKMYQELANLFKRCPPAYQTVLNSYGEGLKFFLDKNTRSFKRKIEEAQKNRDYIMNSYM